MIPGYDRFDVKLEVRMGARLRDQVEVLARFARARSVSDYLRTAIEEFVGREQRRLGLTDEQVTTGVEMLKREKASARNVKPLIRPRRGNIS